MLVAHHKIATTNKRFAGLEIMHTLFEFQSLHSHSFELKVLFSAPQCSAVLCGGRSALRCSAVLMGDDAIIPDEDAIIPPAINSPAFDVSTELDNWFMGDNSNSMRDMTQVQYEMFLLQKEAEKAQVHCPSDDGSGSDSSWEPNLSRVDSPRQARHSPAMRSTAMCSTARRNKARRTTDDDLAADVVQEHCPSTDGSGNNDTTMEPELSDVRNDHCPPTEPERSAADSPRPDDDLAADVGLKDLERTIVQFLRTDHCPPTEPELSAVDSPRNCETCGSNQYEDEEVWRCFECEMGDVSVDAFRSGFSLGNLVDVTANLLSGEQEDDLAADVVQEHCPSKDGSGSSATTMEPEFSEDRINHGDRTYKEQLAEVAHEYCPEPEPSAVDSPPQEDDLTAEEKAVELEAHCLSHVVPRDPDDDDMSMFAQDSDSGEDIEGFPASFPPVGIVEHGIWRPFPTDYPSRACVSDDDDMPEPRKPKRRKLTMKQVDPLDEYECRHTAWARLCPGKCLRLPLVFGCLLAAVTSNVNFQYAGPALDCVETFSGVGAIVNAYSKQGFQARGFDTVNAASQDINSHAGFMTLLSWITSMQPGAFLHFATPCSTWVQINAGTSMRRPLSVEGDESSKAVRGANLCVNRMVLLLLFAVFGAVQWMLEQPSSSQMPEMPRLWRFLRAVWHVRVKTCMGGFGAATLKHTQLHGSEPWMKKLHRTVHDIPADVRVQMAEKSKTVVLKKTTACGKQSYCGGPSLKQTQAYTPEFATGVVDAWILARCTSPPAAIKCDSLLSYDVEDLWHDAQLAHVFEWVRDTVQS